MKDTDVVIRCSGMESNVMVRRLKDLRRITKCTTTLYVWILVTCLSQGCDCSDERKPMSIPSPPRFYMGIPGANVLQSKLWLVGALREHYDFSSTERARPETPSTCLLSDSMMFHTPSRKPALLVS